MSEELVVNFCSPTMAGIKTGSLFSCAFESREYMHKCVSFFNLKLVPKGLRMLPLKYERGRGLIYLYRPDMLKNDLSDSLAIKILRKKDYPIESCDRCVIRLIKELQSYSVFPHEIGLFLGYPPEDVHGFIENKAQCPKCVGTWKVYGDEEQARRRFEQYEKCTSEYLRCYKKNNSFEKLIVAAD